MISIAALSFAQAIIIITVWGGLIGGLVVAFMEMWRAL